MKRTSLRRVSPNKVKYKKPKGQVLKKKLDVVFSKYIRHKYADSNGNVACYTCTTVKPIAQMQNGHWIPRNILATRFDERNCRPQCVACNMFQRGRPDVFAVKLLEEYGGGELKALQARRQEIIKDFPYEDLIAKYTKLLGE